MTLYSVVLQLTVPWIISKQVSTVLLLETTVPYRRTVRYRARVVPYCAVATARGAGIYMLRRLLGKNSLASNYSGCKWRRGLGHFWLFPLLSILDQVVRYVATGVRAFLPVLVCQVSLTMVPNRGRLGSGVFFFECVCTPHHATCHALAYVPLNRHIQVHMKAYAGTYL